MSVNDFKRGAESTAYAHYAFMRKQGEATAELGKRLIKKIDQYGNLIDVIIDELNFQEMQRVFGIHKSLDIDVLGESDKVKLLSYLGALTVQKSQQTSLQNKYFSVVKRYLNISGFDYGMDLTSISELDISKSELKAFFECVCEFLFLKTGSRSFLTELHQEIECFGFNDKIIEEIVSSIEQTYKYFGVQGILDHYDVISPKHEKEKQEPIKIPFFENVTIVYENKIDNHPEQMAELLKERIETRLSNLNVECGVGTCTNLNYSTNRIHLEKEGQIIFINIPPEAKAVSKNISWEYDEYGMRFGTFGRKSIIDVSNLKNNQYTGFIELLKSEQEMLNGKEIPIDVENSEMTFFKEVYGDIDCVEDGVIAAVASVIAAPLLIVGAGLDAFVSGIQATQNAKAKDQIQMLQYIIAFEKFLDSKITPFLDKGDSK